MIQVPEFPASFTAALRRASSLAFALVLAGTGLVTTTAMAQPGDSDSGAGEGENGAEQKSIEDILEDSDRIDGLFTLYRDRNTGDLVLDYRAFNCSMSGFASVMLDDAGSAFLTRGNCVEKIDIFSATQVWRRTCTRRSSHG